MPEVDSGGVRIHYDRRGAGEPLVLIHGYTASVRTNWEMSGWLDALSPHYRLIAPDLRGHGRSEKPHRSAAYSLDLLARDVLACMDAEGVDCPRVFGYSMGGMVTMELLLNHPDRVRAAVIGGMGSRWPSNGERRGRGRAGDGEMPPPSPVAKPGVGFLVSYLRQSDPLAFRAAWEGVFRGRQPVDAARLGEIRVPVLAVAGTRDALYPGVTEMVPRILGARLLTLPDRGHLNAVRDPRFKRAVLEFFANVPVRV